MPSGSKPARQVTLTDVAPGTATARTFSGAVSWATDARAVAILPVRKYANAGVAVVAVAATAQAIAATSLPARRVRGIMPTSKCPRRLVGTQVHRERAALT